GTYCGSSSGTRDMAEVFRQHFALDLSGDTIQRILDDPPVAATSAALACASTQSKIEKQMAQALHWYRKAQEANVPEHKVANTSIAIESALRLSPSKTNVILRETIRESKVELARAILPATRILRLGAGMAAQLYTDLYRMVHRDFGPRLV